MKLFITVVFLLISGCRSTSSTNLTAEEIEAIDKQFRTFDFTQGDWNRAILCSPKGICYKMEKSRR